MVDYGTQFDVVWHGALQNDPLGGLTKGCLLAPRDQDDEDRQRYQSAEDMELTRAELLAAVNRLNASLKQPLDLSAPFAGNPLVLQRAS